MDPVFFGTKVLMRPRVGWLWVLPVAAAGVVGCAAPRIFEWDVRMGAMIDKATGVISGHFMIRLPREILPGSVEGFLVARASLHFGAVW